MSEVVLSNSTFFNVLLFPMARQFCFPSEGFLFQPCEFSGEPKATFLVDFSPDRSVALVDLYFCNPEQAEWRLGMSVISGELFDRPSLSPPFFLWCLVLLLFLSCHFSAAGPCS